MPRQGQWLKFEEPIVVVNGVELPLSEHFPDVQLTGDGKVVGIFTNRILAIDGPQVPAQVTIVDNDAGQNISCVNAQSGNRETMVFIEQAAQKAVLQARDAMADSGKDPGPAPICLGWPSWESLGVEPLLEPKDLPPNRQTAEGFRLRP